MFRCCRSTQSAVALMPRTPVPFLTVHLTTNTRFFHAITTTPSSTHTVTAFESLAPLPAAASVDAPPQTYVDYLDRVWNSKWFGTVDEQSVAAAATTHTLISDPSWFAQAFTACQHTLGVEPGTLVFLLGAATRLCTLFFSLYGERASERMRLALPELKTPQEEFNRVYYNDLASAMQVQVAASVLKSQRRAAFRKYNTSNLKCVASLASAPVIMTGLYQVSSMCENTALDVGCSSFLWCGALTLPDPFMILPVVTCAVTLLNFELSISKEIKMGWMKNIIWGARLGCFCIIPVFSTFRSGVCLYLVGMNVVGLLQPLLLRSAAFRQWFGFPSAEDLAAVAPTSAHSSQAVKETHMCLQKVPKREATGHATSLRERIVAAVNPTKPPPATYSTFPGAAQDVLQASVTVQFPYLSHLLNPQVEENEELFTKARSKQSKPEFSRNGPVASSSCPSFFCAPPRSPTGSRYARGTNPLMREMPLHRHDTVGATSAQSNRTTAEHGYVAHLALSSGVGGTAGASTSASAAVAPFSARRAPKNKGSFFASSGWKSSQLSFDENDFIPSYDDASAPSSSVKRK